MRNDISISDRIDGVIRFFLYALMFWLPYSTAAVEVCVSASLILWVIKRVIVCDFASFKNLTVQKKGVKFLEAFKPKSSFLNIPILCFLVVCLLSSAGSIVPGIALRGLLTKTLEWFIIYFLIIEVFTQRKYILIALAVFLFSALATCLDSIVQFHFTHKDIFRGRTIVPGDRAVGPFSRPNSLGGYLTFVVPLVFSFILFFKDKLSRRFCASIFLIISLWSAIVSFSRGAWIGVGAGIFLSLSLITKKLIIQLVLLSVGLATCFYIVSSSNVKRQIRIEPQSIERTLGWRTEIWTVSLRMVKERPIFGHGLNTYMRLFQEYRRKQWWPPVWDNPTYAHNCYIQIAAETGILGLMFFLWILGRFYRKITRMIKDQYRRDRQEEVNWSMILMGLLAGILAFLVQSFFDTNFYSLQLSTLFWFMFGLAVTLFNQLNHPRFYDTKIC